MGYDGFSRHGLSIVAAFDTAEEKTGKEINGHPVFPLSKLPDLAQRMHISMAILAVPGPVAQPVTEVLVEAGIHAIWNFAPTHLDVPDHVVVQDEDLARGLAVLSVRGLKHDRLGRHPSRTPQNAIIGEVRKPHTIDVDKCVKCGTCAEVCKFDAVKGV